MRRAGEIGSGSHVVPSGVMDSVAPSSLPRSASPEHRSRRAPLGIIAGTGFADLAPLDGARGERPAPEQVDTAYGPAHLTNGTWHGQPVAFLPRHGPGHTVPPHRINYRANIAALQAAGCRDVLAINAVGSIDPSLADGDLVCLNDFLDFTKTRVLTFHDGTGPEGVVHVDVSEAYHPQLRAELLSAAGRSGQALRDGGVYAAFEGPRFESPAEIRMAGLLGAQVAGMTGVPECTLALEAGLRYAAIAVVCNPCAGLATEPITVAGVERVLAGARERVLALLETFVTERVGGDR